MRNIVKGCLILGALVAAGCATAEEWCGVSPILGVDFQQVWMKGKKDFNKIFPQSYPGGTLYVGVRFHENFGLELGYDSSTKKHKNWTLPAGIIFFGNTVSPGLSGRTTIRRLGGHLDLIGYLPVIECTELTASIGVGVVQPKINISVNAATSNLSSALASISAKARIVGRLGIGANYMVTDMIGVRLKLGWESTTNLRAKGNISYSSQNLPEKAFRGSTTVAAGVFVKF